MKIVAEFPPNIHQIVAKFKITPRTVYAYGDTLYNPSGLPISQDLMIHEQTHEVQQQTYGVEQWWDKYLKESTFRLTQEVEAYREQWKFLKSVLNRLGRRAMLDKLASDLSSELYGSIINKKTAKELIDV